MLHMLFFPVCFLSSHCLRFWICVGFEVVMIGFKKVKEVVVSISKLGFWVEWGDVK